MSAAAAPARTGFLSAPLGFCTVRTAGRKGTRRGGVAALPATSPAQDGNADG